MIIKAYQAVLRQEREAEEYLKQQEKIIRSDYLKTGKVLNVNVFRFEKTLYIYIESCDTTVTPEQLFPKLHTMLNMWPDGEDKYYYPLIDIFHFNVPQSITHWSRKVKPEFCTGMISKIIPDSTARYIFYHYQMQEETPGSGAKYGRIFLMGDTVFYYSEKPDVLEKAIHKGALATHNTPVGNEWQKIMGTHFIWWDENKYPDSIDDNYNWEEGGYPENCRHNQWLYIKNILSVI